MGWLREPRRMCTWSCAKMQTEIPSPTKETMRGKIQYAKEQKTPFEDSQRGLNKTRMVTLRSFRTAIGVSTSCKQMIFARVLRVLDHLANEAFTTHTFFFLPSISKQPSCPNNTSPSELSGVDTAPSKKMRLKNFKEQIMYTCSCVKVTERTGKKAAGKRKHARPLWAKSKDSQHGSKRRAQLMEMER